MQWTSRPHMQHFSSHAHTPLARGREPARTCTAPAQGAAGPGLSAGCPRAAAWPGCRLRGPSSASPPGCRGGGSGPAAVPRANTVSRRSVLALVQPDSIYGRSMLAAIVTQSQRWSVHARVTACRIYDCGQRYNLGIMIHEWMRHNVIHTHVYTWECHGVPAGKQLTRQLLQRPHLLPQAKSATRGGHLWILQGQPFQQRVHKCSILAGLALENGQPSLAIGRDIRSYTAHNLRLAKQ